MEQKTVLTIGLGAVALVVLYLVTRGGTTVIQQGADYVPQNYATYNVPRYTVDVAKQTVEYKPADQQATTQPVAGCMCDSGCGDNGEYAGALRSIMQNFYDVTTSMANAYQDAVFASMPPSIRQYINNEPGYIASRRALAAIGTATGVGGNLPANGAVIYHIS